MKQKLKTKEITLLAVFVVLDIVLTRFLSINVWNIRIGLGFIPTVMVAHMYGPKFTIIECGIADIIGAILFPTGAYFVGFTISAMARGLIWGYLLYENTDLKRVIVAIISEKILCTCIITPISIAFLYGISLKVVLIGRIGQVILVSLMEIILIPLVIDKICPLISKRVMQSN